MLDQGFIKKAIESHRAVWADFDGLRYVRFVDDYQGVNRGTAIFDDQVVYGYPSIGRVLALQSGLKGQFHAPFWMEEKVDGFNVRVFKLNHRILALTRGGFVCPFTTDRIADLMNLNVFEHEPAIVLCGEVVGPDNPYMEGSVPYIKEDVKFFIFDIGAINQKQFMVYSEKEFMIKQYELPSVQHFGRFKLSDMEKIGEILLQLNKEYREGVVFKEDSPRNHRAKYATSNINIVDIEAGAYTMFDLPPEYFKNRIARLVLFMDEQGVSNTLALQQQLGTAYVKGLLQAIQQVHEHHKVFRTFRCRFRQRENAVKMLEHLSEIGGHVQITLHELKEENGYWWLEFDKVFPKSSGTLSSLLKGSLLFD
ncbi:RNA ligase [Kaarinaea lacus]